MPAKLNITAGDRYERLIIIKEVDRIKSARRFLCQCDCGNTIEASLQDLRREHTKSCGCYKSEITASRFMVHGDSGTRLFRIWATMIARCFSKNTRGYRYYGSRGITVCNQWLKFIDFKKWALSSGYTENLTIERKDNDGNYEPQNCTWITQAEQTKNSRHNQYVFLDGVRHTLTDAAIKTGISRTSIYQRMKYMTIEQAFNLTKYQHYAPRSTRKRIER
jgi:hypothetical protein